ncbi:hypothetical protein PENDEC_c001G06322 [Penicillium decumbens]|uniref:Uncharacterized protein n=1 Tax=Penicillium decumbens TaxID=69771 RepID=A0A1V6PNL9_PENDC|nr:hypothetical protein PENDEC_c001G06322 [Penicillium decumbens]
MALLTTREDPSRNTADGLAAGELGATLMAAGAARPDKMGRHTVAPWARGRRRPLHSPMPLYPSQAKFCELVLTGVFALDCPLKVIWLGPAFQINTEVFSNAGK